MHTNEYLETRLNMWIFLLLSSLNIFKYIRQRDSRIAVKDSRIRKRFRRWLDGKMCPAASKAFLADLKVDHWVVYNVIEWGFQKYGQGSNR